PKANSSLTPLCARRPSRAARWRSRRWSVAQPKLRALFRIFMRLRRCGSVFRFLYFLFRFIRSLVMFALSLRRRSGTSLIELLVVIAIIATLSSLMLVAVNQVRVAAKRLECISNLRQLGIAAHVYENTMNVLPTENGTNRSLFRALLPYVEAS